jgi:nucleotide-binding universal stress UspA family protein
MTDALVVPLDGSDLSESALPVAEQLSQGLELPITLLTSGWGSNIADLDGYLSANAAMLDSPCTTVVIPDTFPATAIVDAIQSPADVVVMATHGRSGIGRALLGSVAEDLMKRADNSVVLIGPNGTASPSITGGRLLVTIDGSPRSAMILPTASRFAKALNLEVIVVTVGPPGDDEELLRAAAASVGFFRSEGGDATHKHLVGTDIAGSIVELAEQLPASLVAMATHGRGGFGRTALGSTTMRVVHRSPCPVIVERSRI